MTNLKNMMAAVLMVAVLMVGATSARAGILLSELTGSNNQNSCTEQTAKNTITINGGILVAGFTGILVAGFTGILVAGLNGETTNNCENK